MNLPKLTVLFKKFLSLEKVGEREATKPDSQVGSEKKAKLLVGPVDTIKEAKQTVPSTRRDLPDNVDRADSPATENQRRTDAGQATSQQTGARKGEKGAIPETGPRSKGRKAVRRLLITALSPVVGWTALRHNKLHDIFLYDVTSIGIGKK